MAFAGPAHADLSLSPSSATVPSGGNSVTVQVISTDPSATWTASADQSWLTFTSAISGKGNGSFSYSVPGNPGAISRTANVTVATSAASATQPVTQLGGVLNISPSSANAAAAGDSGTVTVSTNQDSLLQWTATASDPWVIITAGASGIGPGSVQWRAAANTVSSPRTAVITVTPLGGVGQTFTISQQLGSVPPSVTVSPSSVTTDAPGGSGAIQVTASSPSLTWSAISSSNDIVLLTTSSGTGNGAVQYTVKANPIATNRTATITLTPQGGTAVTVTVTLLGGTLSISPSSMNVPGTGGSGAITLTTNDPVLKWTVSADQNWVTITSGGQGTGPGQIQWTAAVNTTNASRSSTISITPSGGAPQSFYVNEAAPVITGTITLTPPGANALASGSSGTIQVTSTNQALTWMAVSNNSWLTVTQGASGTGNGSFQYSAAGNPTAAAQTGTITVTPANGTGATLTVVQAGGTLTISPPNATANPAGDTGSVSVSTNQDSLLQWTAATAQSWITITSGASGTGSGAVQWTAAANATNAIRSGSISVTPSGGTAQVFTINQQVNTGTITLNPTSVAAPASASSGTITVTSTNQSLPWTAVSSNSWLTLIPGAGTGAGSFQYSAAGNPTAASQTATITVTPLNGTGATLSVTQAGGTLTISPTTATAKPAGDAGTVSVSTADSSLQWTATKTGGDWLTITGASGTGPGSGQWTAAANTTNANRSGTISITPSGGTPQVLTITQAAQIITATITLTPSSVAAPASTSNGTIQVMSTNQSLTWTAVSSNSWLTITQGATGTGNGSFQYSAAGNPSAASQTATITVTPSNGTAGVLTVTQAGGTLTISPTNATAKPAGDTGTIAVSTDDSALQWTATKTEAWITITAGATGTGTGSVQWTAAPNTGTNTRTTAITITPLNGAAQTFTITQAPAPTISLSPSSISSDAPGTSGAIQVTASSPSTTWSAGTSNQDVVVLTSSSGTGNGAIQYTVKPNPLATTRTATITVTPGQGGALMTVTVTLAGGTLTISPASASVAGTGGSGSITVTTNDPALRWTVSADQSWVTITSGGLGTGAAQIQWTAAANTTNASRSSTISVTPSGGAAQLSTINQAARVLTGTITLIPGSVIAPASISNGTILVTSTNPALPWTAASSDSWLTITHGATGTGNSTLQYNATGNPTAAMRTATITVTPASGTGDVLTVNQAPGLLIILPFTRGAAATGDTGSFSISTNNSTLQWSAVSNASWLSITTATSGAADATMSWAAAANTSANARTATITITPQGGTPLTFTVIQAPLSGTITAMPSTLSFSYQQLGTTPAAAQITLNASAGALPFTASAIGSWLSVMSNGSATPGVLTVSVNPSGMAVGTYQGAVLVTSAAATNSPVNIPVTFTVSAAPVLTSAPNALSFSYQQNGSLPGSQNLAIGASGSSLGYTIAPNPDAPWITATGAGPAPATITVSVNPAGLAPGTYQSSVSLISPASGNSPFVVPVSLTVSASPNLIAAPTSLVVTYGQLDPAPDPIQITVTSSGAALAFTPSVSPSTTWLTLSGISQIPAVGSTPARVQFSVDPSGLAPGDHQGSIILTSANAGDNPLTVPVTLTVLAAPTLSASPSQVSLGWTQNVSTSSLQSIAVLSTSPVGVTATVQTAAGGNWLTASISDNQTPAVVTLSAVGTGLAPGVYNGALTLTSPGVSNSPVVIPVTLSVSAQPQLLVSPATLNFSYQLLSGPLLPQKSVSISTADQATAPVSAVANTSSGGNWLTISGGTSTPGAMQLSADPTGLPAGVYPGTVMLTSPGYAPATVNVTLRITTAPVLIVPTASLNFAYQQGGAPPMTQAITISSGSPVPFGASAGTGAPWLTVTGGGTTPASVSVSVNPAGLSPGTYSGSLVLTGDQAANSPVVIPVQFTIAAGITLAGQPSSLSFTYTQQGTVPPSQPLTISSSQPLNVALAISAAESWLNVQGGGSTPAGLQISVDPDGLTPGTYSASILVSSPTAVNSPLVVPVTLVVQSAPAITPSQGQYTFSYQVGGMGPSNQTLTVNSTQSTLAVSAAVSTTSGGNWLTIMGGGNIPAVFSIAANPAGLSPGTYQGSIVLSAEGAANSPATVPVTFVVAAAPVIAAAPSQLAFSYTVGGVVPAGTAVQVTSSGTALTYQVSATTDTGGPWLQITSGGNTPGTVTASVSPVGLAPGTYTGTIALSSDGAGNTPLLIPVTIMVSTSSVLTAAPASVQFLAQQDGTAPASQTVHLDSGGTPIAVTYQGSPGTDWLSFTGGPNAPGDLIISVSPAGLIPGRYTGVILVVSSFAVNSPLEIPVTFDVNATPVLNTLPSILQFAYSISGARPTPQAFSVGASSGPPLPFNITGGALPPWLFASGTGTTPGTVSVSIDPGGLAAGVYQNTVQVSAPGVSSPVSVQVVLTVTNAPSLASQPAALNFAYQVGAAAPTAAAVVVSSSDGLQTVVATPTTISGGNWLIVSGGGNTPAAAGISVNPAGLAAGLYQGQVTFTASGAASPLSVPVTLTVSAAPTLNLSFNNLSYAYQLGGSTPPNQQITITASDGSSRPVSAVVSAGGSFVTLTQDSSTTPATLTLAISPIGLSAGVYRASIVLTSTGAGNSPVIIPVTLTISSAPSLTANPGSAVFSLGSNNAPPLPVAIALGSTGTPLPFSTSVVGGSPWIVISGAGTTPAVLQISVNAAGLTAGIYTDAVAIASPGAANNPLLIPITLVVSAAPLLTAAPASLSFVEVSTHLRDTRTLAIGSTSSALTFSSSISSATSWLSASGSGTTPGGITVSADATGLTPGTYQGAILISSAGAANSPLSVPVSLLVMETASLQATPTPVSFSYKQAGPAPSPQTVGVTLGGQPAMNTNATAAPGEPWLSVQNGAGSVTIGVNPAGLLSGTYSGSVLVESQGASNSPLVVPVSLVVAGLPEFDISQSSVAFTALQAQSQPVSSTISLTTGQNPAAVDFELDVTASTWLTVTPTSGTTPMAVTVTADPTGLRVGSYSGSIIVSSNGKRLQTTPVNLTVANAPTLTTSPPFLVYSYSHGGSNPSPVNLYIGRFGADIPVTATPSDPWISVNPSTPSTSGPIAVTVNPAGLPAGIYQGSVTLTAADGGGGALPPAKQVAVTLYVDQPANPQIFSVPSGMSFLDSPIPPGMIFSIFGSDIGPAVPVNLVVQPDGAVSQSLGGVQVLVNGIPCPLIYVSSTQINAIAPYALYTKNTANIAVQYLGVLSDEVPVIVNPSMPGLFSYPPTGSGPGAILNQDMSVNTHANPAARGSIISLFGGGDGQSAPQGIDGLVNSNQIGELSKPLLPVTVTIGGVTADVQYAGAAPTLVSGVIQVNVRIPASLSSGDLLVVLTVGGVSSQSGLMVSVK